MQSTSITWADWVWNPIKGCDRISPGCLHCYAEALAARHSVASAKRPSPPFAGFAEFRIVGGKREAHWTGKVELVEHKLLEPLSWRRKAIKFRAEHGRKPRAFISMSDLFHESLPDEAIDRVMAVAALTQEVNWMFLTKRAKRMSEYFSDSRYEDAIDEEIHALPGSLDETWHYNWPFANIALGVSVESQRYADERIPHLLRTPAAMRFVSYEPALEAVDWDRCYRDHNDSSGMCDHEDSGINMIIVGGESGSGARPFDIAWARSTVEQCRAAGIAPFVKQMGSNPVHRVPAKVEPPESYLAAFAGLKDRKGEDMSEWPEDLRGVREWPEGWN